MKKIKKASIIFVSLFFLTVGCVDDLLDTSPQLTLTKEKAFANFNNTQKYALGFYTIFPGYSLSTIQREFHGDLMSEGRTITGSDWIWNRVTVPASSGNWDFSFIRKVNLMLEGIENSNMTQTQIDHWKAVGYFFRAYEYFNLLKRYGAVPWIDQVVSETDEEVLFGPRTPRDEVATNILADLLFAEEHILEPGTNNIVPNSVGVGVVRALISRFGLFEGTWRKYHDLSNTNKYLQASFEASAKLIEDHPDLHPNFGELFNSASLEGMDGMLLYKQYELGELTHLVTTFSIRSGQTFYDITKKGADIFLLTDGQTRWNSPLFKGDKSPYSEFKNRDQRMYYTIMPPYRVEVDGKEWEYTDNPQHRENIDLMEELSNEQGHRLPIYGWDGSILHVSPHYRNYDEGYPSMDSDTGYLLYKFYHRLHDISKKDINDYPIFRIGEVLINHAEAAWELGDFSQQIADKTINKLRERAGVAPLITSEITSDFDPTRDPTVEPILWEIRRERAVELMAEGFRFDDLRRWKKMHYTNEKKLGRWIRSEDVNGQITIQNDADEGYISSFGTPPPLPDYYYLYPIPSDQIALNPEIEQNTGW